VERVDEPLTFCGVAGIFQSDEADVHELSFPSRLRSRGSDREEGQREEPTEAARRAMVVRKKRGIRGVGVFIFNFIAYPADSCASREFAGRFLA
jgi:hypothetical protein